MNKDDMAQFKVLGVEELAEREPFAWMAVPKVDITLRRGVVMVYDPVLTGQLVGQLADGPADARCAVWTITADRLMVVQALQYGHTSGHPHLDVYFSCRGVQMDAQLCSEIKASFFGTRLGVGLDVEHYQGEDGSEQIRCVLAYCPTHDPAVRKYIKRGRCDG